MSLIGDCKRLVNIAIHRLFLLLRGVGVEVGAKCEGVLRVGVRSSDLLECLLEDLSPFLELSSGLVPLAILGNVVEVRVVIVRHLVGGEDEPSRG